MTVDFLPFLAISILLIVMPGPDTAVVTKNALLGGRRSGVFAAIGVSLGLTVWTIAAALGIAALLEASAVGFLVLKVVGAIYLMWIGIQLLRARDLVAAATRTTHGVDPHAARAKALRQGLLSDLSNPKIAVFFTSFLPQFVHGDGPVFAALLLLGLVFAAITLIWLAAYGVVVGHASAVMRRPAVRTALDRVTGVVLIVFGVRLGFEERQAPLPPRWVRSARVSAATDASDALDRALARFAEAQADQNERDFAALQEAVASGRIAAEIGV